MSLSSSQAISLPSNLECLIAADVIAARVAALGAEINQHYQAQSPSNLNSASVIVVGLLRGAFMFLADLCRHLNFPHQIDFMTVSSYGDHVNSSHNIRIVQDLNTDIADHHVLIVEDIVDTGYTLQHIQALLSSRQPASLHTCTLLDKPCRREVDVAVEFVGFEIADHFVVGYGLDYAQRYRHLPYLGTLLPHAHTQEIDQLGTIQPHHTTTGLR